MQEAKEEVAKIQVEHAEAEQRYKDARRARFRKIRQLNDGIQKLVDEITACEQMAATTIPSDEDDE